MYRHKLSFKSSQSFKSSPYLSTVLKGLRLEPYHGSLSESPALPE